MEDITMSNYRRTQRPITNDPAPEAETKPEPVIEVKTNHRAEYERLVREVQKAKPGTPEHKRLMEMKGKAAIAMRK